LPLPLLLAPLRRQRLSLVEIQMDGKLLSVKDAAMYLFGEANDSEYKRTLRIVKNNDLQTVRSGKKIYVARDVLDKFLGIEKDEQATGR
tara:strand:+ start:66 stop:332 length:267 start_codon:yes stop_codon:yes gene_type:complete